MIQEIEVTWDQFEETIRQDEIWRKNQKLNPDVTYTSDLLYRGHSDATWKLTSTLERYLEKNRITRVKTVEDYYNIVDQIETMLLSFLPQTILQDTPVSLGRTDLNKVALLIYLRHHGFPSFLLDWTQSPYVAAHFAFRNTNENRVAIYSFREIVDGEKHGWSGAPFIQVIGPIIKTHRRHYLQQGSYTFCIQNDPCNPDKTFFRNHDDVEYRNDQDVLKKYILDGSERRKVLARLNSMNINDYSLFQTDDGLMSSLAYQIIEHPFRFDP